MKELNNLSIDKYEDVDQKECVGCGKIFLVFKFVESDKQYCTKGCRERHSIFFDGFQI